VIKTIVHVLCVEIVDQLGNTTVATTHRDTDPFKTSTAATRPSSLVKEYIDSEL